jgi:predicted PurR-regulated permease PerM
MENENASKTRFVIELAMILLILFVLLYTMYNVVSIFLGVLTFAIIFAVALHGLFEKIVRMLGNRRKPAAIVYGLLLLLVVALPFSYLITSLVHSIQNAMHAIERIKSGDIAPLPDAIAGLPMVGPKLTEFWEQVKTDPMSAAQTYGPQLKAVLQQLLAGGTGILGTGFELMLGIIVSAVFLYHGQNAVNPLQRVVNALAGEQRGPALVEASGKAIKGVAIGVMGTAFIAAFVSWLGYRIAGMQLAVALAAVTFILVVIQVGPLLVALPVTIWFFANNQVGWGIFMIVLLVVLMVIDNVVKPMLIARSGKLPVLVLFIGVVGGMAAWGFTGMFKGAIILSVAYTLFQSWFANAQEVSATETSGS